MKQSQPESNPQGFGSSNSGEHCQCGDSHCAERKSHLTPCTGSSYFTPTMTPFIKVMVAGPP